LTSKYSHDSIYRNANGVPFFTLIRDQLLPVSSDTADHGYFRKESSMPSETRLSIIIPVFNEEANIQPLLSRLAPVLKKIPGRHEAVFVDDGSEDATFARLNEARKQYSFVKIIRLNRNSGKSLAYRAGFLHAQGSVLMTIDGDLQDDPVEIPLLLAPLEQGYDMAIGWKTGDGDSIRKPFTSRVFSAVASYLTRTGFHDVDCPFRAMKAKVGHAMEIHGDLYRFIPILAKVKGFRIAEVKISNHARYSGHSKYSSRKMIKGFFDLLTLFFIIRFRERPLHFFGLFGALMFVTGFTIDLGLVLQGYFLNKGIIGHWALLLFGVMIMIMGIQIVSIGLLGELIITLTGSARQELPIESVVSDP
jgi:glycosyltransferase involved in cell wall biosynthesis